MADEQKKASSIIFIFVRVLIIHVWEIDKQRIMYDFGKSEIKKDKKKITVKNRSMIEQVSL